jgi:hypothetical protein
MKVSERTRIELPEHVPPVFEVYVSGVRQVPGRDFELEVVLEAPAATRRALVFPRPLAQEGRLGFWRWASMWLGIAGSYRDHETIDVVYEADGRREVETGLTPQPYEADLS